MLRSLGPVLLALALLTGCGAESSDVAGPTGAPAPGGLGRYVALGDSYSAAPGVPDAVPDTSCFRSTHNYPHLIAAAVSDLELVDVTCSGAATADMTSRQQTDRAHGLSEAPQFDALTPSTRFVSVSIGGNDLHFFQRMLMCLTHGGCEQRFGGSARDEVVEIGHRLDRVLRGVHQLAPQAKVVVVGYPRILPTKDSCPLLHSDPTALAFARTAWADLVGEMRRAARSAGDSFVDLSDAASGHDLCAAEPWFNGPVDNEQAIAWHPYTPEQAAAAKLVGAALAAR
ncbi:MAG: SGNH/GDSL hydrolase family protein [Nocardioides sp.]